MPRNSPSPNPVPTRSNDANGRPKENDAQLRLTTRPAVGGWLGLVVWSGMGWGGGGEGGGGEGDGVGGFEGGGEATRGEIA